MIFVFYRSAYGQLKSQNTEPMEIEFVQVSGELKGHVIGKNGIIVKEMMNRSGARINSKKEDEGFTVSGNADQRACAKRLILEKVVSSLEKKLKVNST